MKRRGENEDGWMDGWTDTRGGNVLINGRAPPPLPRGRINIFGCSTTRGRRQCRE